MTDPFHLQNDSENDEINSDDNRNVDGKEEGASLPGQVLAVGIRSSLEQQGAISIVWRGHSAY